ncbi:MAG: dependent ligase [Herbinix sp.]|jgi:ATP-dependent DNA ligase|nr:dependent ligase [Herbinix sp.]
MDIFDSKNISPMLISEMMEPFDSEDYIYEIKFDGIRSISYLDKDTDTRNKRNKLMTPIFPELADLYQQVKDKCILDHELVVLKNGVPDFYEVQKRALMSNPFKIKLAAERYPASIIAYDILYYNNKDITMLPLLERKKYLEDTVIENNLIAISRYVENNGIQLFELVKQQNLEGIVAKKRQSLYWQGKKTKDWIKCKIMATDDCVICGYIPKENNMTSLVLGQYDGNDVVYRGHVTLGVSMRLLQQQGFTVAKESPFEYIPKGNEEATWMEPTLVGIVESMPTEKEAFRQPTFKGFRDDKSPRDCQINNIN